MTRNLLRLRGLRIVAAVSVLQAFLVGTVLACQCGHGGTPEGLLQSNDAVFVGVAMRTVAVAAEEFVTTFVVVEGFKGVRAVQSVRVRHREKSEVLWCQVRDLRNIPVAAHRLRGRSGLQTTVCALGGFYKIRGVQRPEFIGRLRELAR